MNPHIETSNPIYRKPVPETKFDQDFYTDYIFDADGKRHLAHIKYEGYYYDGSLRIVKLEVATKLRDKFLLESVSDNIGLREGKRIELECSIELIKV